NKVLDAIDYANNNGFKQIKINCVVKKGTNEHAIIDLITHFKNSDNIVRFIEYMDVGNINGWNKEDVLSLKDIITIIENKFELYKVEPNYLGEVANRYRFKNGKGEIGIISSVSKPFCHSCTRSRITMDGKFVTCLFANEGLDLRKPIRDDLTDTEILKIISDAWMIRDDRYSEIRNNLNNTSNKKKKIEMFQLGG
ncbi:MAG: GTP 3',8-cyclase MoaA, partial [Chloroflexota bacterium]|nr:GTP 3',8-cyclase MoaA [Chloroflexota bacterium]